MSPRASCGLPGSPPCRRHGSGDRNGFPIQPCTGWGLPCRRCCHRRGALLPHHFTLTRQAGRCIFCGTFHELALSRRYLAPCLMEPGLSSARPSHDRAATVQPTRACKIALHGTKRKPVQFHGYNFAVGGEGGEKPYLRQETAHPKGEQTTHRLVCTASSTSKPSSCNL